MHRASVVVVASSAAVALSLIAGCSSSPEQPARTAERPASVLQGSRDVAYAFPIARVAILVAEGLPTALDRYGSPLGRSRRASYAGLVLLTYLRDERDLDLLSLPPHLATVVEAVERDQDIHLLILTDAQRRRYSTRLRHLRIDPPTLKRFYDAHEQATAPEVGDAMADWLELIPSLLEHTDPKTIIVVPVID